MQRFEAPIKEQIGAPERLAGVDQGHDPLRVCFICTGNRCRSPLAEHALRSYLGDFPAEITSVGLLDLGPVGVPDDMVAVATGLNVDLSEHRARPLIAVDLSGFDLILGLERNHVAAAVVEGQAPAERTFTLAEVVRLLKDAEVRLPSESVERARAAVREADELRRAEARFVPGEDVEDPFGAPARVYSDVGARVAELCRQLADGLLGRVGQQP